MFFSEIISFSGYYFTNKYVENYLNKKNARNFIAGMHAFSSVIGNSTYLLTNNTLIKSLSLNLSIGYFLYDSYYIIRFDKAKFLNYCYLYHHFASLYMIYNYKYFNYVNHLILLGEFSNLPSYFIYHYLHLENKTSEVQNKIVFYKGLQRVVYTIIRIPVMSYFLKRLITTLDLSDAKLFSIFGVTFPVYLMGLFWSAKIVLNK